MNILFSEKIMKYKDFRLVYIIHNKDLDIWTATFNAVDKESGTERIIDISDFTVTKAKLDYDLFEEFMSQLGITIDKNNLIKDYSTFSNGNKGKNEDYFVLKRKENSNE